MEASIKEPHIKSLLAANLHPSPKLTLTLTGVQISSDSSNVPQSLEMT